MSAPAVFNQAICERRKDKDVMKLLMSDYKVTPFTSSNREFLVKFHGPKDSLYEGGVWTVSVSLPEQYPYKSPSIGFHNKIFHPNIDERSGSVCLDVINQTWSPMFDLINVFDVFLPQLLLYPNPADPLNPEAAAFLLKEPASYESKVKDYVKKFASDSSTSLSLSPSTGSKSVSASTASGHKKSTDSMDEEICGMDEEEDLDNISHLSDVSELSQTSEISLLEEC